MTKIFEQQLKILAEKYSFRYHMLSENAIRFETRSGKIFMMYDHFLPSCSAYECLLSQNLDEQNEILNNLNLPCVNYVKAVFENKQSAYVNLLTTLNDSGIYYLIDKTRKTMKICTEKDIDSFVDNSKYPIKIYLAQFPDNIKRMSAVVIDSKVQLIVEKACPFVIGDGESTLWELLIKARVYAEDESIDLNQIIKSNEKFEIVTKNGGDLVLKIINDQDIISQIDEFAGYLLESFGYNFYMLNFLVCDEGIIIDNIDFSVNLDEYSSKNEYCFKHSIEIYEKALRPYLIQ